MVISGGCTMNRESALLGVPTPSIINGDKPYFDNYLAEQGKISIINETKDIKEILIAHRQKSPTFLPTQNNLVSIVVDTLLYIQK